MSVEKLKSWLLCLVSSTLVACGGGSPGTGLFDPPGGTSATMTLSVSTSTVTATTPATVTVTLRDANGAPISGRVVDLSMQRGNLAVLGAASILTNASGVGTVSLQVITGGAAGADEVIASANLGTTTVRGTVGFTVASSVATLTTSVSSSTLKVSSGPSTFTVVVRDAGGRTVSGQVVKFSAASNLVTFGAASALSDATGTASVSVLPKDPTVNAAEELIASTTVGGVDLQGIVAVRLVADKPTLAVSLSSSAVTVTSPSTVRAVVKDTNGNPVAGALVSFSTVFGLGTYDVSNAVTDVLGVASAVLSPKTAASNGADLVSASSTVGGVVVVGQSTVQFTAGSATSGTPVLRLALSSTSISSATPATVTASLTDSRGAPVAGQVVAFTVVRNLAKTNVATALTDAAGNAVVVLSPSTSTTAGADEVTAATSFAGVALQATKGFQVQATNVTLTGFSSAVASLGAYGQTVLTISLNGASVGSPVNINVTSACVALGKATLSPSTFTATTATVDLQYKDNGCGALQATDQLQATILGSANSRSLSLPISVPTASSLAFVSALPATIFLKGSGFAETSTVTFEVRDGAGNTLPNRGVVLALLTLTGGVTMEGGTANVTRASDAFGRVSVRVNSGTVPTPIRIAASLADTPSISTVSSSLSVAVGLPSQLNFSLSQQTLNIEGYNIDGTPNTYSIIASDRSGNPVPVGTSINFITEGGQVEPIKQTQLINGLARTSAAFVSAEPRPVDGRVTVTVYALGEESFIDQNGNNSWDAGEPFQDLGNVFKDRVYDGVWDSVVDEFVPLQIANSSACVAPGHPLLGLNPSIPTVPGTCDGIWSGAGKVYVRRAVETVLSTSAARPMWGSTSGLSASCFKRTLQNGPQPTNIGTYTQVGSGDTWYTGGASGGALFFLAGDANPIRFNPMAAGTTLSATTPTTGLAVTIAGGSPLPSSSEVTAAAVAFEFAAGSGGSGVIFVTFTSPSGVGTTFGINVTTASRPSACP